MDDQKIISIKTASDDNVIDTLNKIYELLTMAKNGKIEGLAIILLGPDNVISTTYCGTAGKQAYTTIGALSVLKARLINGELDNE